jgi:anthranilate phosphoribosyltransferase
MRLAELTTQLSDGDPLGQSDVADAAAALLDETTSAETKVMFLRALAAKGETADSAAA